MDQGGVQRARSREKRKEKYPALFRKLDNEDYEHEEIDYPYTKKQI